MLGVFKRRWKPKRSSNVSRLPGTTTTSTDPSILDGDKLLLPPQPPPPPSRVSSRQVYPVCDDKKSHLNGILTEMSPNDLINGGNGGGSPPPYPKRASLDSNHPHNHHHHHHHLHHPSPTQCYPLAPNICVEAGRIQFIKQDIEGVSDTHNYHQEQELPESLPTPPATPRVSAGRVTVTRGQQTEFGVDDDEDYNNDRRTNLLEQRIQELEVALETAQKNELRDKQTISKLQKQIARRESAQRDADRERRLRADSESRAKQALQEAARCRSRLKLLTNEFARMEETVRSMLVYKKQVEQLRQEKNALTVAFENRCQQYQTTISRLNNEITTLRQQLAQVGGIETNPEEILHAHAAALQRHAEESRKQYERCLDDVANQVVRALLTQKGLREEVGSLNNRIQELEQQNRALTSMLVHQLRGDNSESPSEIDTTTTPTKPLTITSDENNSPPISINDDDQTFKHSNSFNSEILEETNDYEIAAVSKISHRLSSTSEILDTRLSLEDKRRHQVLTQLWTELKGSEVTPKKLLDALSAVDSALWVPAPPPQRPVSLNLHLPILQQTSTKYRRNRPILAQNSSKSEEETTTTATTTATTTTTTATTTGNESPESGNRDEGYSTMSSDVQTDLTRNNGGETTVPANRGLEDLKEATDETDNNLTTTGETRLLVTDNKDPDILYIPFNLLNLKSRNSYPPGKDMLPFQHIMRSFSDSHLCIKITTAPSPCYYTFTSPISSSPSILLLDITEKKPLLKRTRATNTLYGNNVEFYEDNKDDRLECTNWDSEYIQQWLRLDETRSTLQQQRDLLELEYDRTELEDWSLSLSNDDLREQFKRMDVALTPGQISVSTTLPSIQENNALELEEDSNECLWNNSSYMIDKVTFQTDKSWPYAIQTTATTIHTTTTITTATTTINKEISPDNSWSSGASDCCHSSHEQETCSKRSSAALSGCSGCSDDTGDLPAIGTDFTRDFYRLVKFESTKSLASTSSRSLGGALSENGDQTNQTALNNVLTFISDSVNDITKEFNIEGPPPQKLTDISDINDGFPLVKQQNIDNNKNDNNLQNIIAYADEVCLVTPLDVESENCSNITEQPVDICSSINVEITSTDYQTIILNEDDNNDDNDNNISTIDKNDCELNKSSDMTSSDTSTNNCTSESLTSSISTPETVISKIPRLKPNPPPSTTTTAVTTKKIEIISSTHDTKIPKSKITHKKTKITPPTIVRKEKIVTQELPPIQAQHVITSERLLPQCSSGIISNIIDGPPHRAVSFHERATSKDVIDELNRIIKNNGGDENNIVNNIDGNGQPDDGNSTNLTKLDQNCRPTGWIHVEKDIDLTDPKARANLLDVMMASVSSDSSPTSSCGGSVASDSTEDQPPDYGHLHRLHRFHRQKKAKAARPELAACCCVRSSIGSTVRPTIIGRPDFFVRYGEKEMEAVASFDFLDEFSTTSSSLSCSIDESVEINNDDDDDLKTSTTNSEILPIQMKITRV